MDELVQTLQDLFDIAYYSYGIIVIVALAVTAIVAFLIALTFYLTEAYATYKLSKKLGRSLCLLAWVPILGKYFRTLVICDMTDAPFKALGKINIQNRRVSFLLYLIILILGNTLITVFVAAVNVLPGMGQIISAVSTLLYLIPIVATTYMEFVYLRDAMDLFRVDRKSNRTWALIATIADQLATRGFGRVVCLFMLLKKEPLPTTHVEINID